MSRISRIFYLLSMKLKTGCRGGNTNERLMQFALLALYNSHARKTHPTTVVKVSCFLDALPCEYDAALISTQATGWNQCLFLYPREQ